MTTALDAMLSDSELRDAYAWKRAACGHRHWMLRLSGAVGSNCSGPKV